MNEHGPDAVPKGRLTGRFAFFEAGTASAPFQGVTGCLRVLCAGLRNGLGPAMFWGRSSSQGLLDSGLDEGQHAGADFRVRGYQGLIRHNEKDRGLLVIFRP